MSDRAGGWDAANPFAFRTTHLLLRAVGYPIPCNQIEKSPDEA